jgi:hypothetical protein
MAFEKRKGLFDELLENVKECREPNWDGYGAQPVRDEMYHFAYDFLTALPLDTPRPWAPSRTVTLLSNGIDHQSEPSP